MTHGHAAVSRVVAARLADEAEDTAHSELLHLLRLLTHLVSKDFADFSVEGEEAGGPELGSDVVDVVFFGIKMVCDAALTAPAPC